VSYTDGAGDHTVYVKDAQATVLEVLERARAGGEIVSNLAVKGAAQNSNLAEAFIAYVLSADGQAKLQSFGFLAAP